MPEGVNITGKSGYAQERLKKQLAKRAETEANPERDPNYEEPPPKSSWIKSSDWVDDPVIGLIGPMFPVFRRETTRLGEFPEQGRDAARSTERKLRKLRRQHEPVDRNRHCYKWKRTRTQIACMLVWPKDSGDQMIRKWEVEDVSVSEAHQLRILDEHRQRRKTNKSRTDPDS